MVPPPWDKICDISSGFVLELAKPEHHGFPFGFPENQKEFLQRRCKAQLRSSDLPCELCQKAGDPQGMRHGMPPTINHPTGGSRQGGFFGSIPRLLPWPPHRPHGSQAALCSARSAASASDCPGARLGGGELGDTRSGCSGSTKSGESERTLTRGLYELTWVLKV